MIQGKSVLMLTVGIVIGLAFHAFMYGPQAAYITEQFPARLRYAGSSLAYTLAGVIGGAIAPLVFTALFAATRQLVPDRRLPRGRLDRDRRSAWPSGATRSTEKKSGSCKTPAPERRGS